MAAEFTWESNDPEEAAAALRQVAESLPSHLESAAESIGNRIAGDARRNAPVSGGRLQNNIEKVVQSVAGAIIELTVGTNVEYAQYQEFGTSPFHPPPTALKTWAGREFGDEDAAYAVANSIAETGLDDQRFFADALEKNIDWAADKVLEAVRRAFLEAGFTT